MFLLLLVVIYDALDAVYQFRHVEVDDQADFEAGQAKIRQELCRVDWSEMRDGLHLDDDEPFDQHVENVRPMDRHPVMLDAERALLLDLESLRDQFVRQAGCVDRFEQTGSKLLVNPDRAADNLPTDDIHLVHGGTDGKRRATNVRAETWE